MFPLVDGQLPPPTLSSQTHPQSPSHSVKRPSSPDHPRPQKRIICFIQRQSQIPRHTITVLRNAPCRNSKAEAVQGARAKSSLYSETSTRNKSPRERYSSNAHKTSSPKPRPNRSTYLCPSQMHLSQRRNHSRLLRHYSKFPDNTAT